MHLREEFVIRAKAPHANVAALSREYGISRKTAYKWLARFKEGGLAALADLDRRPHRSPLRASADVALAVVRVRTAHATWGPRKIVVVLAREGGLKRVPSVRTVSRILVRAGLITPQRVRSNWKGPTKAPCTDVKGPNDLWTVDFKGWWRTRDGQHCEPLTVRDALSRYVLALRVQAGTSAEPVRRVFEGLFRKFGLPKAIQSDNGSPFVSTRNPVGLTALAAWWISLGIELVRSRKATPQDNGAHERMHLDMSRELQPFASLNAAEQQLAFDRWRRDFNASRPHEALKMRCPADVYRASRRRYAETAAPLVYPTRFAVRTVDAHGAIKYLGAKVFVSEALRGWTVGLEAKDSLAHRVWFVEKNLGVLMLDSKGRASHSTFTWREGALGSK